MHKLNFRNSLFQLCIIALLQLITSENISAQEQIIPLGNNPVLMNAAKEINQQSGLRRTAVVDTIVLPFEDDFSRPGMYPYDGLWLDSSVFVNTNYPDNPYTIGVATFDGLNQYGVPHNPAATQDSIGDNLTSKPIDLGVLVGDTSVWISFFYQAGGLGDVPETADSIVLQFRDTGGVWNTVWAMPGRSDTAFQRANIRILDAKYFYRGFQFRFYNIATINGNRDHWHIDYVILKNGTTANSAINDNAHVYPHLSLLNEFTSMPYPHYKSLGAQMSSAMKTSLADSIYTLDYGVTSITPELTISQFGSSIFSTNLGGPITTNGSNLYTPYSFPSNFTFPVQSTDSVDFLVKSFFPFTGAFSNRFNDTSYFTQHLNNYYAYDDGTAEVGYGLTGNTDVQIAYKFDVKMRDTLVGAQIYFNPVGIDVSNTLFQLIAWSSVDVAGNSDTRIHSTYDLKPGVNTSINGFKTFIFDAPLVVDPGTIFIGIEQNEPATQYGIGLDRNTDSRSKMYYHLDGFWRQSNIQGSWMIRPIFGARYPFTVGVSEASYSFDFSIYPNPASEKITIELPFNKKSKVQIINVVGEVILEEEITSSKTISIENIAAGIYFARITNDNNFSSVRKFVIN
ncbi:MAG: T9SS type A sorting domain-containing protein [Bacteroidetes bacterium]|nr:T9SS type A sorting domain-containing protein [Bacteroidota bacterium]